MNLIEIIKSVIIGIVQGNNRVVTDKQHRAHDFAGRIHKIECNKIIFRYVFSCNTIRLNFGGNISVFQ